jgi:putative CocE/NonD family hydrolase
MRHRSSGVAVLFGLALGALTSAGAAAAAEPAPPPKLPDPTYQSVAKEVLIPMDDGVKIAATIAWPSKDGSTPAPGRFPVVLAMTPYGRNGVCGCLPPDFFATRGMVGAVADVRGTGGSGGTLEGNYFSPREARDGYHLVEYLGTQPWSTGKVGMAGGSYLGITQYMTAEQQPPHLAAITPAVAISDLYRDGYAHGGIPNFSFDMQYIGVQGAPGAAGSNTDPALLEETLKAKLGQSPPGSIAFDYLSRPDDDQFYRDRSPIYNADRIQVPVLDIGQWHDGLLRGETEMYTALARRRGVETRLHMDPCTHKGCGAPFAPLTSPPGVRDAAALVFEFLSKYLLDTPTPKRAPVDFYLQGRDGYVAADTWPPATTGFQRFALGEDSLTAGGAPAGGAASADYVTDPAAGFSMAFDQYGTVAASPYIPADQRLEGPHGLTFRTPVLKEPLGLVGPLALHLVAASTATDTDWYAKVADVAPDGSESIITAGALRASHRALDPAKSTPERPYHTHTDPQPIEPGRFYEYDVEIWPTAYELAAGHRLQLRLTSTDLPTHLPGSYFIDRDNPQDARVDLLAPAVNSVKFDGSYLLLPVTGAAGGKAGVEVHSGCTRRALARGVRLRGGRRTALRVTLTKNGRGVPGRLVRLRAPGVRARARTNARGIVSFGVRPRHSGRGMLTASLCGGRLSVAKR